MSFFVFGINHNSASVSLREKVAFNPERLNTALVQLKNVESVLGCLILSTCNRTEIYAQLADDELSSEKLLISWLSKFHNLDEDLILKHAYVYSNASAIQHLLKVATGLDSMILGEPQILGQLKTAYEIGLANQSLGKQLNFILQKTFAWSKKIRTQTQIGKNPVSVAYAAVSLASRIFTQIQTSKVLLIGAGETIELVGRHLQSSAGVKDIILANRTIEKGEMLAKTLGANSIRLEQIPEVLAQVDIIITSTASPLPILGKGSLETALKKRKYKSMFLLDLAIPRDIEEEAGKLPNIFLYTLDDLKNEISENLAERKKSAREAEKIIAMALKDIEEAQKLESASQFIQNFRKEFEKISQQELEKSLKELENNKDAKQVLQKLAHRISANFLHKPTLKIKQAVKQERLDYLVGIEFLLSEDKLNQNNENEQEKKQDDN